MRGSMYFLDLRGVLGMGRYHQLVAEEWGMFHLLDIQGGTMACTTC